jgi:hypothetical protein
VPGKLLEGQICKCLDDHIEMNGTPTSKQWGFRKGKSTEGLLMHMTEIWIHALDKGKVVGVLFIDFKKAFDSINHKILYKKLQGVGIADQMLDIISDYLENRLQYVELDIIRSKHPDFIYF